jgi:hypothetical protein
VNPATVIDLMERHKASAGWLPRLEEEGMPEYTKDDLFTTTGRATRDPAERSYNDRTFLTFGLARNASYERDSPAIFFDISVGNDRLKPIVAASVRKGATIAVEGYYRKTERDGKVYHNVTATKVGLISWLVPTEKPAQTDSVKSEFDF